MALDGTGHAQLVTSSLSAGVHSLQAVYTERHANAVKTMLDRGDVGLRPIYDSLIDRLTVLAASDNNHYERRALAVFLRALKDWL